jgi:hypothetical protein
MFDSGNIVLWDNEIWIVVDDGNQGDERHLELVSAENTNRTVVITEKYLEKRTEEFKSISILDTTMKDYITGRLLWHFDF